MSGRDPFDTFYVSAVMELKCMNGMLVCSGTSVTWFIAQPITCSLSRNAKLLNMQKDDYSKRWTDIIEAITFL